MTRSVRAGEHIVIALPIERNTGWQRASCSCGETVESRVPGIVDVWATKHAPAPTVHLLERRVGQRRSACTSHMPYTRRRAEDFHLTV
jgi:hypothetical protein